VDAFPTLTPPFHFARTVRALAAGSFEPEGEEDRRVHTCGLAARVERIQGARDGDVYVQRGIITLLLTEPTTPFVMSWVDLKTVDEIGMEGTPVILLEMDSALLLCCGGNGAAPADLLRQCASQRTVVEHSSERASASRRWAVAAPALRPGGTGEGSDMTGVTQIRRHMIP
jgi:hypothetical protein